MSFKIDSYLYIGYLVMIVSRTKPSLLLSSFLISARKILPQDENKSCL